MTCADKSVAFTGLQAQRIIVNNTNFQVLASAASLCPPYLIFIRLSICITSIIESTIISFREARGTPAIPARGRAIHALLALAVG